MSCVRPAQSSRRRTASTKGRAARTGSRRSGQPASAAAIGRGLAQQHIARQGHGTAPDQRIFARRAIRHANRFNIKLVLMPPKAKLFDTTMSASISRPAHRGCNPAARTPRPPSRDSAWARTSRRFIISMLNHASSAPQAPSVWPRKLFCELMGMSRAEHSAGGARLGLSRRAWSRCRGHSRSCTWSGVMRAVFNAFSITTRMVLSSGRVTWVPSLLVE